MFAKKYSQIDFKQAIPFQVPLSSDKEKLSTSLENCVPYTTYIITMKAKPVTSLIWSEVAEKVVKTKPDGKCIYFFIHTCSFYRRFVFVILI